MPIYHIDRIISETGEPFGDGSHIVYVNGSYKGNDTIGSLMNDFRAKRSSDITNAELAEGVRYYKETQRGRSIMCNAVKKYAKEYAKDVKLEEKTKTILAMQDENMSIETIAKCVRLSVDEVKVIIDSHLPTV